MALYHPVLPIFGLILLGSFVFFNIFFSFATHRREDQLKGECSKITLEKNELYPGCILKGRVFLKLSSALEAGALKVNFYEFQSGGNMESMIHRQIKTITLPAKKAYNDGDEIGFDFPVPNDLFALPLHWLLDNGFYLRAEFENPSRVIYNDYLKLNFVSRKKLK